jgi:asparagine synthase (glutamine-hydrolysing)
MCGIAGFFSPSTHAPELIKAMGDAMAHRGPDDHGEWIQQGLHLAHRRLSIVDLSSGHQPMESSGQELVIVFNGEIYNHLELRKQYFSDTPFQTQCDTEILLHAYQKWGIDMLPKLNGMFAFAIADIKRQTLFMARDRLGQKPLYYSTCGDGFSFSSEIPSLFKLPWMNNQLSMEALGQYFAHEHVPYPNTPFQHIKKLGPAQWLKLSLKDLKQEKGTWWQPSFKVDHSISSLEQAQEGFFEHFNRALDYRMMADVPLGIFLSGGLDSSSCLAQLRHLYPDRELQTFSAGFDNKSFDESSYAAEVAQHFNAKHNPTLLTPESMLEILPTIEQHMLDPIADGSIVPTTLLCEHARKTVTVAIGGDAADELMCGYPTFQAHALLGNWKWPSVLHSALSALAGCLPTDMDNISLDFKIKQTLKGLIETNPIRNEIWLGGGNRQQVQQLLAQPFTNAELYGSDLELWDKSDGPCLLSKVQHLCLNGYLSDGILPKVDRASMFNSLEVRSPFLDVHVIEYLNSVPMKFKQKGNIGKFLLKDSMAERLPPKIAHRSKKGFGMPISHWFRNELKELLHERIQNAPDFMNRSYLEKVFQEHQRGKVDHRKILFSYFMLHPVFKTGGAL